MNAELSSLMEFIRSCKVIIDPKLNNDYVLCCIDGFPIVPFIHHDVEITRGPGASIEDRDWHVHFDYRFFDNSTVRQWKQFQESNYSGERPYSKRHGLVFFLHRVVERNATVTLKQLPCRHQSLGVPIDALCNVVQHALKISMPELDDSAANLKSLNCSRCPHKGFHFDKSNINDNQLHCPMHGQKFLLKDGRWIKPKPPNYSKLVTNYD